MIAVLFREIKATLKMALPIIVGQVGQIFMGVTDSIMVGPLGAAPLAASAFVNSMFNVPFVLLIGLSTCISVKVSQNFGGKDVAGIRRSFWHGLLISVVSSIIISALLVVCRNQLHLFRQPEEVLAQSYGYFIVVSLSLVPMMIFLSCKTFCDAFSDTLVGTFVLLLGLVINIIFNWLLIYGNGGLPQWGLFGAGFSTLICRIAMALAMVLYVFKAPKYRIYTKDLFKTAIEKIQLREMLNIGVPSGLQYLFETCAFAGAGIMMGWISTQALAAHQIAINLASITFMVALGMGYASGVRVGQMYGARDLVRARNIGLSSFAFVIIIELIFSFGFILLRHILPQLYIEDQAVVLIASRMLIVAAIFQLVDGIQTLGIGLLRGLSDVKIPTYITMFSYWLVGLPLAIYLAFFAGFSYMGIWSALATALFVAAMLLMLRFNWVTRKLIAVGVGPHKSEMLSET